MGSQLHFECQRANCNAIYDAPTDKSWHEACTNSTRKPSAKIRREGTHGLFKPKIHHMAD